MNFRPFFVALFLSVFAFGFPNNFLGKIKCDFNCDQVIRPGNQSEVTVNVNLTIISYSQHFLVVILQISMMRTFWALIEMTALRAKLQHQKINDKKIVGNRNILLWTSINCNKKWIFANLKKIFCSISC